jgi:diguanylate cyclase (GGDEF)-like protein/PAS domain S-box-containing protein
MDRSLQILALEDVATEVTRAARELERAGIVCALERVDTESAFRRGLEGRPDVILSDFTLPRFDGLRALRIAQAEAPDIPFIFVSGTLGEERAIEALKLGATDYVLKTNLARLGPVVLRALQECQDRRAARRAEQRFRDLVQTSQDWIWELDVDGRYVFSSPGVEDILGVGVDEMVGSHHSRLVHDDDRPLIEGALRSLGARERRSSSLTARFRHCDGSFRWLERHALALIDDHGLITGFRGTDRDITVRKLQGERIERLNRVHVMLSSINAAILRIRDRQELLQETCRIAATLGGYPNTGILLIEPGTATVRPVALEGEHAHAFRPFALTVRRGASDFGSLTEQALSTRAPAVCNDLAKTSETVHLREEALGWGYRACAALPLIVDGTAIGTLNLHAYEVGAFNEEEIGVLAQVAGSLSFALQYLEKEGAAEFLAYFDPMTGLARRSLFCERLARTISMTTVPVPALSVVVLDVERLGALNDRYGHHGGDRLLQLMAERLKGAIPDTTRLAYFGHGSFGVVVTDTDGSERATEAAQTALARLFDQSLMIDGQEIRLAIRAGAARCPADSTTADGLLQNAEMAVKTAKESGERYLPYVARMNVDLHRRMTLEQQLLRALEERQFVLYYQPKVLLETGAIIGAEALLRWNDPDKGLRSPAEFIPILESSGLIVEVGQWVLAQAVTDALAWHAANLPTVPFAVNVSPRQLKGRDFVDSVLRTTAPLSAVGRALDLEITENALMEDLDASTDKLKRLKAAGLGIAIDDFGTGHSSLGRLARLAVDSLKIDRSFIAGLDVTPSNRTIVSTIVALARSFDLTVIAEGVETPKELAVLRRLKCHEFQGYLAGKPMPAGALQALVTESGAVLRHVSPTSAA